VCHFVGNGTILQAIPQVISFVQLAVKKILKAEGIHKVALVVFEKNVSGYIFRKKAGFAVGDDLIYRNKNTCMEE